MVNKNNTGGVQMRVTSINILPVHCATVWLCASFSNLSILKYGDSPAVKWHLLWNYTCHEITSAVKWHQWPFCYKTHSDLTWLEHDPEINELIKSNHVLVEVVLHVAPKNSDVWWVSGVNVCYVRGIWTVCSCLLLVAENWYCRMLVVCWLWCYSVWGYRGW